MQPIDQNETTKHHFEASIVFSLGCFRIRVEVWRCGQMRTGFPGVGTESRCFLGLSGSARSALTTTQTAKSAGFPQKIRGIPEPP